MACFETGTVVDLAAREAITLPNIRGATLRVTRGTLWLTEERRATTSCCGRRQLGGRIDGNTVVEAQGDATFRIVGPGRGRCAAACECAGGLHPFGAGSAVARASCVHTPDTRAGRPQGRTANIWKDHRCRWSRSRCGDAPAEFKSAMLDTVHAALVANGVPSTDRFQRVLNPPPTTSSSIPLS